MQQSVGDSQIHSDGLQLTLTPGYTLYLTKIKHVYTIV